MVDTMITLHESTETSFTTNGLGALSDAIFCEVTEERNGEYELEMEYPITGIRYEQLRLRRIIMAKPNPYSDPQPFRIYSITKPINGIVTVNAEHISYDMSGYPVSAFVADNIQNAFSSMKKSSAVPCLFSFSTDKTTVANMEIFKPSSMRSLLGGMEGSILDIYGGEYEFDKFNVKLWNSRGSDRGVSIRYGKNLTDLKQEENCSSVYTGVYPFWYSEQYGLVQLDEKIVKAAGTYDFTRIFPLDLSQEWTEKPSKDALRTRATSYMKANNIGVPAVSLTVSFVQLSQSTEYADYALLEDVRLCDTVRVEFPELKVSAISKCIKTTYDAISNKYVSIELGESRSNLASTISDQKQAISESITKTYMQQAIENATQQISGGLGGYVMLHSSTNGKYPDEILIMDTDDISTAQKVWRWNKGGLGYSSTGYNGPFALAMTQDGQIVADFIKSGSMSANRINGGTLTLGGKNNVDGVALIKDSNGNVLIRLDRDGIALSENVKISYDNISNTPGIPTKSDITKITKDTVTTDYVNSLKVVAGSVNASDIEGTTISGKTIVSESGVEKVKVTGGLFACYYKEILTGHIINSYLTNNVNIQGMKIKGDREYLSLEVEDVGIMMSKTDATGYHGIYYNGTNYFKNAVNIEGGLWVLYNNVWYQYTPSLSDRRLKKNFESAEDINACSLIQKLNFKSFDFKGSEEHQSLGLIAQELMEIIPECVNSNEQPTGSEFEYVYSLSAEKLTLYALKAIKELIEKNEVLEKRLNELSNK